MDFGLMIESVPRILGGAVLTLELVVISLAIGFCTALGMALMRLSSSRLLSGLAYGYVFVIRGTPLLVQIYLIYFGISQFEVVRSSFLWPWLREPFWCAVLALTVNTTAYGSEIIRGGIQSVPWGQIEAARAAGMSRLLLFRRIVFPIAIRQALPAYSNEVILMVKATSLASTITLLEMTGISVRIISQTFAPVEIFLVAGSLYLAINFLAAQAVRALEWVLTPYRRPAPNA